MKVLIIGFVWPEPKSSAAGSRMMQLIQFFLAENYTVTFATSTSKTENAFNLKSLGIHEHTIELNSSTFDDFISQLQPDIVLFDRFLTEEQFGWRVAQQCPKAIRILDTEDVHGLRKGRELALKDNTPFNVEYLHNDTSKREIASIYRCDVSLIISEAEMELLIQEFGVPTELLHYMPFLIEPIAEESKRKLPVFEDRNHFITIGNFLHPPNLDSVKFLYQSIWSKIRTKLPKAEMHIYGAYQNNKAQQFKANDNGFIIKGFAEDVDDVMQYAKVCLSPLRFGAGLKGKFFDAMRNGTPFVTTSIGAEGILESSYMYTLNSEDVDAIVEYAIRLYNDKTLWKEQQNLGFNVLKKRFDKQYHIETFKQKLQYVVEHLKECRQNNFTGQMLMHHTLQSTKYMSKWIEEKNKKD